MRCELSVLPDRHFVQMPRAAQVKFKSSVAGALHPSWCDPKLEQGVALRSANGPIPVDRHYSRALH
jgi:hypothetical protein